MDVNTYIPCLCALLYYASDYITREKNRAKKIAKLNDDSCANDRESQDIECEERDSFHEAREKKNTFERNRYKANSESKKDSMKAYYD